MWRVESVIKTIEKDIINKDILEVACGCAEFSLAASPKANSVNCIDLNDKRLPASIYGYKNIIFTPMDAAALQFAPNTFDTVIIYNSIGHLEGIVAEVINQCRRVVKVGGSIYIISSFMIDKHTIRGKLIPFLEKEKINYAFSAHMPFEYVKVSPAFDISPMQHIFSFF